MEMLYRTYVRFQIRDLIFHKKHPLQIDRNHWLLGMFVEWLQFNCRDKR